MTNKIMNKNDLRMSYQTSDMLDEKRSVHELYSSHPINLDSLVIQEVEILQPKRILDVGCGNGAFIRKIQQVNPDLEVHGLDFAFGILKSAATRMGKIHSKVYFSNSDMEYIPYKHGCFDVVTAIHCLSHLPNLKKGISEIIRIIDRAGTLIVTTNSLKNYPHVAQYRSRLWNELQWEEACFTTQFFSSEAAEHLLANFFDDVFIKTYDGELELPVPVFVGYFIQNVGVWNRKPSRDESDFIKERIQRWSQEDSNDQGLIIEPKTVSIAICRGGKI